MHLPQMLNQPHILTGEKIEAQHGIASFPIWPRPSPGARTQIDDDPISYRLVTAWLDVPWLMPNRIRKKCHTRHNY